MGIYFKRAQKVIDCYPYDDNEYIDFAKRLRITDFINENSRLDDTITIIQFFEIINSMIDINSTKSLEICGQFDNYIKNFYDNCPNNLFIKDYKKIFYLFSYINEKNNIIYKNINNIISNPYDEITIFQALLLLKTIFSFILKNKNNEYVYNEILNYVKKYILKRNQNLYNEPLNMFIFYKILYHYLVFLFQQIDNKNNIKYLFDYWNNSPLNVYNFLGSICLSSSKINNSIQDKAIVYMFNHFHKIYSIKKYIKETYKSITEINEFLDDKKAKNLTTGIFENIKNKSIVYHYTSLTALYQMLEKSNKLDVNNHANIILHMSNVEYLNDPNEGKLYLDKINQKLSNTSHVLDNRYIDVKNTYILCFSSDNEERLPMWIQYADGAKGCRIQFEVPMSIDIHKMHYTKTNHLPDKIQYLIDKAKNVTNEMIKEYIKDKLNEVQYYYKDKYYEHEKEVRYTINVSPQNALQYDFIREGEYFPRLYCETPYSFPIKSVMLGPKCPNPEQVALYLKKMGVPEVLKSEIKFQ